jgi:hypothetical protein
MEIIVRDKRPEPERRKSEAAKEILRHYYGREIRDGTWMKLVATKERIKRLYEQRS